MKRASPDSCTKLVNFILMSCIHAILLYNCDNKGAFFAVSAKRRDYNEKMGQTYSVPVISTLPLLHSPA